jgi:hypothetical protein
MKAEAKRRRSQRNMTRAMKSNAGVAVIGIITFGHESQHWFLDLAPEIQDQAMRTLVARIAEEMNTTATGLVLHFDETAPHAHFSTDGYDLDGEPISNALKKGLFYRLQDIAHQELQAFIPALERGHRKKLRLSSGDKLSDTLHRSVQQLHVDLPAEIAQKNLELDVMVLKLEKNTALAAKAAEKAAGDDERAEKARKRLISYERRAEAAQASVAALEATLVTLQDREAAVASREALLEGFPAREDALSVKEAKAAAVLAAANVSSGKAAEHLQASAEKLEAADKIFERVVQDKTRIERIGGLLYGLMSACAEKLGLSTKSFQDLKAGLEELRDTEIEPVQIEDPPVDTGFGM